jgi:CubicO group peptidase (beta-lactamase class C family)
MQLDAIFRLASVTKPIVTVAALRLVEDGRLHLDDAVTKYLPDFQPRLANGGTPDITANQLLTHTAGLSYGFLEPPDGPYHQAGVSDGQDQPGLSMAEELKRIS